MESKNKKTKTSSTHAWTRERLHANLVHVIASFLDTASHQTGFARITTWTHIMAQHPASWSGVLILPHGQSVRDLVRRGCQRVHSLAFSEILVPRNWVGFSGVSQPRAKLAIRTWSATLKHIDFEHILCDELIVRTPRNWRARILECRNLTSTRHRPFGFGVDGTKWLRFLAQHFPGLSHLDDDAKLTDLPPTPNAFRELKTLRLSGMQHVHPDRLPAFGSLTSLRLETLVVKTAHTGMQNET